MAKPKIIQDIETLKTNTTASSLLTSVKTVDGASSGLDADTLDGSQLADFGSWVGSSLVASSGYTLGGGGLYKNTITGQKMTNGLYFLSSTSLSAGNAHYLGVNSSAIPLRTAYFICQYMYAYTYQTNYFGVGYFDTSGNLVIIPSTALTFQAGTTYQIQIIIPNTPFL